MKKVLGAIAGSLVALMCITLGACDDDTETTIGSTLVNDAITVQVDSAFTLTGVTLDNPTVQSRTTRQLLGIINAPQYGYLRSDVVTQFMPANMLDTLGISAADIDSLHLLMQFPVDGGWTGDSLVPMSVTAYPLTRQISAPIYSDFNPEGYYDKANPLGNGVFTASAIGEADTLKKLNYRQMKIELPLSLGRKLFTAFEQDPKTFSSPEAFARIFPGLYLRTSFGTGRVTNFYATVMRLYYHQTYFDDDKQKDTTLYKVGNYFAVTPEIVSDNILHLEIDDAIKARRAAGEVLLMAPAGYEAQLTFPARDVVAKFNSYKANRKVLNTLTMKIPVEAIDNAFDIEPPSAVLLVLKSKKNAFFAKNQINDNKTSFLARYDATNKCYTFDDLRDYALGLIEKGNDITPDDYEFILTPVTINTESDNSAQSSYYYYYGMGQTVTEYIASIVPYVETPVMCKLNLDKADIVLTFSTQSAAK